MVKTRYTVVVNADYCKGCGLCIDYCKKGVLVESHELNVQGYHYATPDGEKDCTGCRVCTLVCPEVAIEVYSE